MKRKREQKIKTNNNYGNEINGILVRMASLAPWPVLAFRCRYIYIERYIYIYIMFGFTCVHTYKFVIIDEMN